MPLIRKQTFVRKKPDPDLKPEERVFFCEATKEVFRDYEEFFQRTLLCNSLVWTCSITGKANLTYEEALDSEKAARKRLGNIPGPLKKGLLWLADHAQRGRISDLVDDVYVFASGRYFKGEVVEAIVGEQWCDCKVVGVIPPTQEEIDKDAELEREEQLKDEEGGGSGKAASSGSPSKAKKAKKSFFPPEHLFKYELEEIEEDSEDEEDDDDDDKDDNDDAEKKDKKPKKEKEEKVDVVHTIDAEDIRREKGTYTREKNLLFLKNITELGQNGNFAIKAKFASKYKVSEIKFSDLFAGPMPVFEITKRVKTNMPAFTAKNKKVDSGKAGGKNVSSSSGSNANNKNKAAGKGQGTLDGWVKGDKAANSGGNKAVQGQGQTTNKVKKQTAAEIEAEMKRIREQNDRFKEEMRARAEEERKRKIEERAREKERKKEQAKLLKEVLNDWKKPRDDLDCEDLKALPKPTPVRCKIPNKLFGDFLTLLEFFECFSDVLEVKDFFGSGITFEILERALTESESRTECFEVVSFMLQALFDLQNEEDDEVKLDKADVATINPNDIEKATLGKDEDVASQIKSATAMARWPMKHQGQSLCELHMNEWSITEILRLHLEAAGGLRSEKLVMWLYQQRGGYRLSDDPGLHFRMEHPEVLEALTTKTVYELDVDEKIKVLTCLMLQIMSFATVRDDMEEKAAALHDAKINLRDHQWGESRRQKALVEANKQKRREELIQKKEEELKAQEEKDNTSKPKENGVAAPAPGQSNDGGGNFGQLTDAHLTERQRLAIQSKKESEEKEKVRKEEILRSQAEETERQLADVVSDLMGKSGRTFLGRDRAFRRYWITERVPGLYVEHDDENVGECLACPTPWDPNAKPLDEEGAMAKVKEILDARMNNSKESNHSDKENDAESVDKKPLTQDNVTKTYSKKANNALKQKVLSAKNGSLTVAAGQAGGSAASSASDGIKQEDTSDSLHSELNIKTEDDEDSKTTASEDKKKPPLSDLRPWGLCSADVDSCVVHSTILPRTYWSYYGTVEEVDALIDGLNERGVRESDLKEKLRSERDRLVKNLKRVTGGVKNKLEAGGEVDTEVKAIKASSVNGAGVHVNPSASAIVDLTLRDQILEMEEKIFIGNLGTLKIRDRLAWQEAIRDGGYDMQCEGLAWGGKSVQDTPFDTRLQSAAVSRDPSRPASPSMMMNGCDVNNKRDSSGSSPGSNSKRRTLKKVRELASAILQVAQMIDVKYFKPPLGEDEKEKKKRLKEEEKKKKQMEQDGDDVVMEHDSSAENSNTLLEDWEVSLMNSTSAAQLFIHLTTLESSIMWSKSLLNAKCRVCRKKSDPENMLLCDGCDRGHHLYCLKPKLKSIPQGDWFCSDCKPKMRVRSPKKKSRRVFEDQDLEEEDTSNTNGTSSADASATEAADSDEDDAGDSDNENAKDEDDSDQEQSDAGDEDSDDKEDEDEEKEEDEDSPLRRRKKPKRDPPTKKATKKKGKPPPPPPPPKEEPAAPAGKRKPRGLSQLLGQRRCATEASERIARDAGNSSGTETPPPSESARAPGRSLRDRRGKSSSKLTETPPAAAAAAAAASGGNSSGARSKRRRAVDDDLDSMFNPTVLEDLLNSMMRNKDGWPFDRPITKADAPDYHKIVRKPMDLGTIRSTLNRMKYTCNQEVIEDIRQVFENCWLYNRSEAEEYQCGLRLEKYFLKEAKKLGLMSADEVSSAPNEDHDAQQQPPSKRSRRTF